MTSAQIKDVDDYSKFSPIELVPFLLNYLIHIYSEKRCRLKVDRNDGATVQSKISFIITLRFNLSEKFYNKNLNTLFLFQLSNF